MLNKIQKFFDRLVEGNDAGAPVSDEHRVQVATAALLVELSRVDNSVTDVETRLIEQQICTHFALTEAEAAELIELANSELTDASCLHEFTRLVNEHLSGEDRIRIVEMLWEVAYADQVLESWEEHITRRISDLLYVSHSAFIRAKLKAQK